MPTLAEILNKNAAESVGRDFKNFLSTHIKDALSNPDFARQFAKDPLLSKLFDGMNNPNQAEAMLTAFKQHVEKAQNENENKLRNRPTPNNSGGKKLVEDFVNTYTPKPRPN